MSLTDHHTHSKQQTTSALDVSSKTFGFCPVPLFSFQSEWFHGRCIGMKPQEAKKSRHYYCDTCQRIRSMFGVGTNTDEHAKLPAKPKGQSKKDTTPRPNKSQRPSTEADDKLPPLKIRAVFHAKSSSASEGGTSNPSADPLTMMKTPGVADSYPQSVPKHQAHDPSQEASRRRLKDDQRTFSTQFDTPLTAAQTASVSSSYIVNSSHTSALDQVSRTVRSASSTMEEEDEDVCPVCDFQCTCNNNSSTSVSKSSLPSTSVQATNHSHSFTAIKVPFRPNPGLQAAPNLSQAASINSGHQLLFPEAEKRPVVPVHVASTAHDDSFHTSLKNPMSTPSGQGASSIARRGGKATAKSPFPVQGIKTKYSYHGHDRRKRNGNTPGHLHYQPEASYDSDMSGGSQGGDYERVRGEHRARYESDSDDVAGMDDTLSLSSSNSLSDLDETSAQLTTDTTAHSVGTRPSSNKPRSRSDELVPSTSTIRSSYPISEDRRHKDSIMTSREPEIALYTPGAANRKLISKGEPSKVERVVKPRVMAEVTYITYDPDVAEDVAALNAFEAGSEDGDGTVQLVRRPSRDYTEDDIFGDGDLSDELSGDLSEIQSEDLDDLSDDLQDFSSIEEDDDDDDEEDSSPKEFNYSDLEEQDESLLDSDSSINSISTDSSDSSDSATDSGMEVYLQDISDLEDENHGGSDELMDEDELLLLEEQEQLILAKAHGLHDVFSEEDSDPDRNPFESSDDDEDDADDADADIDEDVDEEEAFDGDDDYYSDDYYDEDDYSDAADDMDEQEIIEQLQGVQSDMQALMMIPPEQQEQLLLLQHYEEAHRQQQQQLTQDPMQDVPMEGTSQQMYVAPQISQGVDLLADPGFLPTFDLNVPDLDAVSEQLAASLANSFAKSMSASQGLDGSLFSEPTMLGDSTLDDAEARFPNNPTNTPLNISPKAPLSASPESEAAVWNAPLSSTHCSLDLGFTSIPPPANISGPLPPSEALDQKPSPVADHLHDPNSPSHASMSSAHNKGQKLKMQASQGKIQSLPNSALYKPLSSILSVHRDNGYDDSLAAQHSLSKASATDPQLSLLNQSRLQSSDPNVFKEAAQKALSGLHGKAIKYSTSESGPCGAILEDLQAMGDAMDGTCTDMHIAELKRRKDDEVKAKEVCC